MVLAGFEWALEGADVRELVAASRHG
jgi:hypothetical protein